MYYYKHLPINFYEIARKVIYKPIISNELPIYFNDYKTSIIDRIKFNLKLN